MARPISGCSRWRWRNWRDENAPAHLAGRPSRYGCAQEWVDPLRPRRVRLRVVFADQQGFQAHGPRSGVRRFGDGDRYLSDGEVFRQADGAAAGWRAGAIPAWPRTL